MGIVALVLGCTIFASGCGDLIDIDKKALVVGVGLDAAASPDNYEVTLQYLIPSGQGGAGGGGVLGSGGAGSTANRAVTITAAGVNVSDTLRRLRDETDRFIYLGDVGDILIGQALARRGVLAPLDYFLRAGQVAESTQMVVVAGRAADLLSRKNSISRGGAALPLFEFLRLAERAVYPASPNVLWRFLGPLYTRNRAGYLPIVRISSQGRPFRFAGTALFLRGSMVGRLTGYAGIPLDWLIKGSGYPDALVRLPESAEPVALRVIQVRKRWRVRGPNTVALDLRINTNVREANGIIIDDSNLTTIEHQAALRIRDQVRRVLDTLQRDGTDVIGLSDRVFARYPADAADWPARFSRLRLQLKVTVRIYPGGRRT